MVTETTAVKQEVRLREWSAQVEAKQTSGLTVPQWRAENGINLNTYYYRLKKVREQFLRFIRQYIYSWLQIRLGHRNPITAKVLCSSQCAFLIQLLHFLLQFCCFGSIIIMQHNLQYSICHDNFFQNS